MIVDIRRKAGSIYVQPQITEASKRSWRFMGEDTITLEIETPEPISFLVGDYISYNSQVYTLNTIPTLRKTGHRRYAYTAVFESTMYDLGKVMYLLFTDDPVNPEPLGSFDLEGTAQTFANQIITNLNRVFSGWSLSGSLPSTEYRNIFFEGETCLAALHKICEEFGLEFTITGKVITINYDLGTTHTRTFSYGKGNGLYELNRVNIDSKEVITRLYAFGSDKNLPADYRNYSPRLKLANDYVEANVATYGVIEHTEIFEDIFPTREGTVSYVKPDDAKVFRDSGLDFDVNSYLLSGLTAKVHFRTGLLAGYTFEINSYTHESGGSPSREFAINVNKDEKDFEVPSSTLKPAVGDKYVLLDIKMPQSYIDAAETALIARAQDFIDKYSKPQVAYELKLDPMYLDRNPITLAPGDFIQIGDTEVSIYESVRVLGMAYPIIYPERLDVDLSEEATPSYEQLMYRDQQQLAALKSSSNAKAISIAMLQKQIGTLSSQFTSHNHNDLYYTKTESDGKYSLTTHNHDSVYAALTHFHAWADISGKPSAFPPEAHGHSWSDIIGYPGVAWDDITGKPSTFTPSSHTLLSHTASGLTAGHFLKATGSSTFGFAAHGLTYTDVGAAAAMHWHSWSDITDKPSTFTPSAHGHSWSDIIGFPGVSWSEVTDKPTTFTPSSHTLLSHTASGLTSGHFLKATGSSTFGFAAHGLTYSDVGAAASLHWHAWADISGKPSVFPPEAHGHSWDDMLGTLSVEGGGTGQTTFTANKLLVGNGTGGILSPTELHWDNSNKRLGIGITPSSVLHTYSGTANNYLTIGGIVAAQQAIAFTDSTQRWAIYKPESTTDLRFWAPAPVNDVLVLKADGKVGIGTTAPAVTLHVSQASAAAGITSTTGTNYAYLFFQNTGGYLQLGMERSTTGGLLGGSTPYAAVVNSYSNNPLQFGTNNTLKMTLTTSGDLGLGITTPTKDGGANGRAIHIHNTGSYTSELRLTNAHSGSAATDGAILELGSTSNLYLYNCENAPLYFGTNNTARMIILGNGNVGVGLTNPSVLFHVNGAGYFSGNVSMAGTLTVSGNLTAADFILGSDIRLKENLKAINHYQHEINYYAFNYKNSERLRFGVIAQELEKVYPSLVNEDEKGFKNVSYIDLHSIEIAKLKDRIVELENRLKNYGASS